MLRHISRFVIIAVSCLMASCSTTSHLPPGEVLYTGIKHIDYPDQDKKNKTTASAEVSDTVGVIRRIGNAVSDISDLLSGKPKDVTEALTPKEEKALKKEQARAIKLQTQRDAAALATVRTEVDAVLAYAPNGALFGSSTMRTPFPISLWIYNAYADSQKGVGKWMRETFGNPPVLISTVNPEVRARVAANTLRNYGYFHGTAKQTLYPDKSGKKAQIGYTIKTGELFRLDTIKYLDFPFKQDSLIRASQGQSLLKTGEAFSAYNLSGEQSRLETLFRERGYYYYKSTMATFQADTLMRPYWVQLRMRPAAGTPARAQRQYYIGNVDVIMQRDESEQVTDSAHSRNGFMTYHFGTSVMPVRPFVWRRALTFNKGDMYSLTNDKLTLEKLKTTNIFSVLDLEYTLRDTTATCDTLDLRIFAVLDKLYDGSFEMSAKLKGNRQMGPGLAFSLAKRNAFRGAETVSFKVFGSHEWGLGGGAQRNTTDGLNSYEVGTELSFEIPRFVFPWLMQKLRRYPASTTFALSGDWLRRSGYYSMINVGARATYKWHKRSTARHELTLFSLDYYKLLSKTTVFDSIMSENPALYVSMRDQFVPAMSYTFTGTSREGARNTRSWQFSIKQSGNLTSAIFAAAGRQFNEKNKTILGTPYAQFVKATAEFRENFKLTNSLRLATRAFAGIVYAYGNSTVAPYTEQFYIGGANSVRAFAPRSAGPGSYQAVLSKYAYLDQTGDVKLELNAELRFPIFGELKGALFLDAGNVWLLRDDGIRSEGVLSAKTLKDVAVGTGIGVRYDMSFLVLRLDLGVGLHAPYDTGKSSWYNMTSFGNSLMLNFAIGYPF